MSVVHLWGTHGALYLKNKATEPKRTKNISRYFYGSESGQTKKKKTHMTTLSIQNRNRMKMVAYKFEACKKKNLAMV